MQTGSIGRYRVVRRLGEGARGVVYEVADDATGAAAALKVLREPASLALDAGITTTEGPLSDLEIKREFRLAVDVAHPNLVLPYSLESEAGHVFLTMELVRGEPLLDGLARRDFTPSALADLFEQLARGLIALHDRGLVHRDVKSSNVLVDEEGRVRIVDYGLLRRERARSADAVESAPRSIDGTRAYQAPELFLGAPATPASDAYAVGVLLHKALTGTWPFDADVQRSVMRRIAEREAPRVDASAVSAPGAARLARDCEALLHPDPSKRLPLSSLLSEREVDAAPPSRAPRPARGSFVGRDVELSTLVTAFERVRARGAVEIVHVHGRSGMGKSAMLAELAERLRPSAWVLVGRAYEYDAVPYKALDAAMDQLALRISALDDAARAELASPRSGAIEALFPAVSRALRSGGATRDHGGDGTLGEPPALDAPLRRRRGVEALRELLERVSARHGLVWLLDDMQWGDVDSARLLIDLLAPPAPPFLVVVAHRSEAHGAPFLDVLRRWGRELATAESVLVEPLAPERALEFASSLCDDPSVADRIARTSEGCPFLIEMLALAHVEPGTGGVGDDRSFEAALDERVAALPGDARRALAALSLAARPMSRGRVPMGTAAAEVTRAAWATLVTGRLVHTAGPAEDDAVGVYHDRIREAVVRGLSAEEATRTHASLGDAFAGASDAEGAAFHYSKAGERDRAFGFARTAADAARAALAFDRAAQLLGLALECAPTRDEPARRAIVEARARCLADGGKCAEAAPIFLECANHRSGDAALELRREAMEQYLVAGRLDEGRPVMRGLLEELGVRAPTHPWLVAGSLYAEIVRLLIRGPSGRAKKVISARERLLLRTFLSIGKGLSSYESSLGATFFLRAARHALDWGEPVVAARGAAYMASLLGFSGKASDLRRAGAWLEAAERWADSAGDGHSRAFCQVGRGMVEVCAGEWRRSITTFDEAVRVLDARYAASNFEADIAKNTPLFALVQLGDVVELERRASLLTADAQRRGDLALEVESNLYLALAHLRADRVSDAHACVDRNMRLWTASGFHFQHWIALRFRVHALLYSGAAREAYERMDAGLPHARAANLTSMQVVRIEGHDLRGRAALGCAAAEAGRARARTLDRVERDAAALSSEKRAHALAPAENLRGGAALLRGDRRAAVRHFQRARDAYESADMRRHADIAALHMGMVSPTTSGRALDGLSSVAASPERWAAMHLGFDLARAAATRSPT